MLKFLKKKTVYQGFFAVTQYQIQHRLFAGGWSVPLKREVVDKCGAAAVLLHDPVLNKLVLIEQFRIGALADPDGPWLIELVAGILEVGEAPEALVTRETQEEAGLEIGDLQFICRYWVTPGFSNEQVTLFYAKVDASNAGGIHGLSHEGEDIRVIVVSPEEAYEALEKGQIKNAPTIIALQWLKFHVNEAC
jgi:ADP-ribose pyrophosphatase